ncbi:uncharacterized protein LOC106764670 isoform X4 [Vigna radiata var. radiata]|uniref:Uncharacterized protein LOC106764670 isoform X4 n=1 Tax=Vigna radiata var. radiata TaxID=3916 RepID=A0A1S3UEN8_VIGRR|nr:uncharacterized protein LOC106764670 isoform X4 [Vigna radiata var. radiata]
MYKIFSSLTCANAIWFGVHGVSSLLSLLFVLVWQLREKKKNIGCFGCCKKTPGITSMDEASKGLRAQEQTVTKMEGSDGFWSSSTFELDHSEGHSQRSISSIGISNNPSDPRSSGGNQSGLPEFVNHGLLLWNQIRQQWIGKKGSESITEIQEPRISSNATYDTLLGSNKPFPQRIPLREMVDFLVDIWDQEGLYD